MMMMERSISTELTTASGTVEGSAYSSLDSMHDLLAMLSRHHHQKPQAVVESMEVDRLASTDRTETRFRNVFSILRRAPMGHARFRRSPQLVSEEEPRIFGSTVVLCPKPIQQLPPLPPPYPMKRRMCEDGSKLAAKCVEKCHCSKRKLRVRRTIRVPAVSDRIADIPSDNFSWRKYGQKPIKGSPYPRGYYKCSNMRGCPARKHVERAVDDPRMLIVTYEGDHIHSASSNTPVVVSDGGQEGSRFLLLDAC